MLAEHLGKHLTPKQYANLLALATQEKISVDEVIVEAISFYLSRREHLLTPEGFDHLLESTRKDVEKAGFHEADIDRLIAEVRAEKATKSKVSQNARQKVSAPT